MTHPSLSITYHPSESLLVLPARLITSTSRKKNVNRKRKALADILRSDMETLWLIVSTRNIVRIDHGTGSPAENTAGIVKFFQKAQKLAAEGRRFVPKPAMLSVPCSWGFGTYIAICFLSRTQILKFSSSFPA